MDSFITIATFTYPHEAVIIKGRLEAEGINCFLQDELTVQVNNFYSNAVGGIKLKVKRDEVEKAKEILKETDYSASEEMKEAAGREEITEPNGVCCPHCNSANCREDYKPNWAFVLSWLLLGVPLLFSSRKYVCFDCHKTFRP
jgi:DNA-directed RNA polymerase subunit RPC12/RpoP